jgi:N-acetylglucosamine repressor
MKMERIGQNTARTKRLNRIIVLQTLLRNGRMSRLQIAEETMLTPATITNLSGELIEEGLITEIGNIESSKPKAGRRSVAIDLNEEHVHVVGVHIRTDRVEFGVVNFKGKVKGYKMLPFPSDLTQEQFLIFIKNELEKIIYEQSDIKIFGVGVASVGLINFQEGVILNIQNIGWVNVELTSYLSEQLGIPVFLDNNGRCMTIAEKMYGNSNTVKDFLFIFIGYGLGAGIVINDKVFRGGITGAVEFGHMTLIPDGKPCWCGNKGCLERYASESFLLNELNVTTSNEILQLIDSSNEHALQLLEEVGERIALVLASFLNMIHVKKVVIAGALVNEKNQLVDRLQVVNQRSFLARQEEVKIEISKLGEHIGIIGGASLALSEMFFQISLQEI